MIESSQSTQVVCTRWDHVVVWLLVFCAYTILNWRFTGPTYLTDEIGYLSNAAFLAGRDIDAGSSYHFGYSLFLLPSFAIFSDPATIWKSVILTNSALFASAFSVLYGIAGRFNTNRNQCIVATLLCAAYPAYPSISGYAFSQASFVLVFLLAARMFLASEFRRISDGFLFGMLTGFLYWVHPTALPVALAAVLTLAVGTIRIKRSIPPALTGVAVMVAMISTYQMHLHPLILEAMTPDGYNALTHYPSIEETTKFLRSIPAFFDFTTRVLGSISYLLIGTLFLFAAGMVTVGKFAVLGVLRKQDTSKTLFCIFVGLSALGLLCATAATFNLGFIGTPYWIYGRYVEGVVLPLLLISMLATSNRTPQLLIAVGVLTAFMILFSVWGHDRRTVNLINTSAFWPFVFSKYWGMYVWFAIGAGVSLAVTMFATRWRKFLMLGLFSVSIVMQLEWHKSSHRATSTPSGIPILASDILPDNTCIGIDRGSAPAGDIKARERFNLYTYYLQNYVYRRMAPSFWMKNCDGLYLSYRSMEEMEDYGGIPLAREMETGMVIYAKAAPSNLRTSYRYLEKLLPGNNTSSHAHVTMNVEDVLPFTFPLTGQNGKISTIGIPTTLFFGPYWKLGPAKLEVRFYGTVKNATGATVDIAHSGGSIILASSGLKNTSGREGLMATLTTDLTRKIGDIEIRMHASAESNLQFHHYELTIKRRK